MCQEFLRPENALNILRISPICTHYMSWPCKGNIHRMRERWFLSRLVCVYVTHVPHLKVVCVIKWLRSHVADFKHGWCSPRILMGWWMVVLFGILCYFMCLEYLGFPPHILVVVVPDTFFSGVWKGVVITIIPMIHGTIAYWPTITFGWLVW